jgi:predicted RNA-binding Zn-ribbon protein involved in translation (DUF1610 family)
VSVASALGPGDLHLAAIARDEAGGERWLREASHAELVAERICPKCRERGCEACRLTGHVVVCEECGAWMAPGLEQVLPARVDAPNGPNVIVCLKCATAVDLPA